MLSFASSRILEWIGVTLKTVVCAAFVVTVLGIPAKASATPIGSFSFTIDQFSLSPIFSISNFSASPTTFTGIALHLFRGSLDVDVIPVTGALSPGRVFQSATDLTGVNFDSARLTLTSVAPGSLTVLPLTGLGPYVSGTLPLFAPVRTPIDFSPGGPPPAVPEPSSLLLVGTGLVAWRRLSGRARRQRRSTTDARSSAEIRRNNKSTVRRLSRSA